jgi:hypothetical protein
LDTRRLHPEPSPTRGDRPAHTPTRHHMAVVVQRPAMPSLGMGHSITASALEAGADVLARLANRTADVPDNPPEDPCPSPVNKRPASCRTALSYDAPSYPKT